MRYLVQGECASCLRGEIRRERRSLFASTTSSVAGMPWGNTLFAGCDGIGPRLLKHCALPLCQPLHHLFSLSLSQSYIPAEWRLHLIKPIFKSGDRSLVQNYRPISLLCVCSKVLERIVFNHILNFVKERISKHQFGFMLHRSTLQQLLLLLNSIVESSRKSLQTDLIYLDFKKAFDSVPHNELLLKL